MSPRRASLLLGLAVLAAAPASATASEIRVEGGVVKVTGAPGERNELTVGVNPVQGATNRYYASESGAGVTMTPGPGCVKGEYSTYDCQLDAPAPVVVDAGDGDDRVSLRVPGTVAGGAGNDALRGTPTTGLQRFDGGPGDDKLEGDATGYCTAGGAARGPDAFAGGEGTDTVAYDDEDVATISASIDGVANDGATGEGDDVGLDVENLLGTACGANVLSGSAGPNVLSGQGGLRGLGGDDTLTGSGRDDVLDGGEGNDRLAAGGGNDQLEGAGGDDFLEGGPDDDTITGGPGKDSLVGDDSRANAIVTGNDTLNADDGVGEAVSCGPGSDTANLDALDTVPVDTQNLCEVVKRSGAAPGGGATPGAAAFPVSLGAASVRPSRTGAVRVTLRCRTTDAVGCNGTLRLSSTRRVRIGGRLRTLALGVRAFSIRSGTAARVTFTLSKANRAALRRLGAVRLTARAVERAAVVRRASATLTLRR